LPGWSAVERSLNRIDRIIQVLRLHCPHRRKDCGQPVVGYIRGCRWWGILRSLSMRAASGGRMWWTLGAMGGPWAHVVSHLALQGVIG